MAAFLALVALLAVPLPASAATAGATGAGIAIYPAGYGEVWLGAHIGPDGAEDVLYCTQARVYTSAGETPLSTGIMGDDAALAWVVSTYRLSTDNTTQAAIAYLVHMRHEEPGSMAGGDVDAVKQLIANATPQGVKDLAAALIAQGEAQGGPYTAPEAPSAGSGQRTGLIKDVGLKSDAGEWIAGATFTITLSGPAVFDATGTNTLTAVTASSGLTYRWTANGNGPVTYSYRVTGLGRTTLTHYNMAGNRQNGLSFGNRDVSIDPVEITSPTSTFEAQKDFVPTVSTTAQHLNDAGSPLDTVTVGLPVDGSDWPTDGAGNPLTLITRHTAYAAGLQPFAQTPTIPSVAVSLGTEILTWTGPGTQTTPGTVSRPASSQFVSWVDEIRIADQFPDMAALIPSDRRSDFMIPAETTSVRHQLTDYSEMREFNVAANGRAFDTYVISGFPSDQGSFGGGSGFEADGQTVSHKVYGPFVAPPTAPEVQAGWSVLTSTTNPARNGTYKVGYTDADKISPSLPGYYVAVISYAGDSRTAPYQSPANDVRQMFYVPAAGSWIDMASTATQNATAGQGVMADTVLVTGNAVPANAKLTWTKCMWVDPAAPGCATPVETYSTTINGPGFYLHPEIPVPTVADLPAGVMKAYYGWSVTLTSSSGQVLDREAFGVASQTTTITAIPPAMTSEATAEAGPGDIVNDVQTLTGPKRSDWTIETELCWLVNGACPDGAAFLAGPAQQIDPDVDTYTSPDWKVEVPEGTAPGATLTLGHAPVIRDALGNEVAREAWGAPGQTTTVKYPLPTMKSKATAAGPLGDKTQDVVEITGPLLAGSRISWPGCYTLADEKVCAEGSTPVAPGPVLEDGTVGIVLPALAVGETLEVTGPEHVLTAGGLLPNPDLRFSWTPIINTPDGFLLVSEAPGVPEQTTVVEFPPLEVVTQAYSTSPDGPYYGDGIGDRVNVVSGDVFPGDTVTVRAYAWKVGTEPVCEGEPLAEKVIELNASTTAYDTGVIYQTPADKTDLVYGFQETTHSRGKDVVSKCGLAAETLVMSASSSASAHASQLAVTGVQRLGLMVGLAVLLTTAGVWLVRRRAQYVAALVTRVRKHKAGA